MSKILCKQKNKEWCPNYDKIPISGNKIFDVTVEHDIA
jgi:hypothetical protein